ncbi:MAG: hypothetical protein AB7H96_19060 [Vicinamibacterales bacterium]
MNVKVLLPTLLALAIPAHGAERIGIRVSPSVAFAPANLFVRAVVERRPENRSLLIVAESAAFYRSSEVSLDGDRAPRVMLLQFKSVPGGLYDVRAVVRGSAGEELASTEARVQVVGDETEF